MNEKHSILYVDDEEHNLVVFEAAYEDYYNIYTASSALEGIKILKTEKIHLIVTDQRMPEMTGMQFLEAIIPEYPDAVRIILTGFTDIDVIIQAINTGRVYQYITKPWNEKEFKVIMDRALENYDLRMRNIQLIDELKQKAAQEMEIRRIFQKYVPETIVNQMLSEEATDLFAGELRVVAVLFSDIRGFTAFSSKLKPDQVVNFLNKYFSVMNTIVSKHKGSVNKFLGDGLIAVFGAPISSLNNAENAVKAALEMVEALQKFNEDYAKEYVGEEIKIGIGINLGEVIAGNIGSEEKMEYTIIGDAVNVASRVEGLTKDRPNSILISRSVYKWVDDLIEVEKLEPVQLRGKLDKIQLYRLLS